MDMKSNDSLESRILRAHERVEGVERDLAQATGSRVTIEERLRDCEQSVGIAPQPVSGIPPGQSSTARPPAVVLGDLLPAEAREAIEQRYGTGYRAGLRLDGIDVVAAGIAGVVGGAVDFLLVGIPAEVRYLAV